MIEILMAVYNGEKYLSEQLESLLNQTYRNFHITIRDNCSTDQTPSLLKKWNEKYPEKITVIYGKENLGVIGNFAALIEQVEAPYIMLSDADDVWLPHKIKRSLKTLCEKENQLGKETPLLVHTDLKVTSSNLSIKTPSFWKMSKLDGKRPLTFNRALVENCVTGCTVMMNRSLLELVRPIPVTVPMHDGWIALVASAFGEIISVSEPTILYRQHGKNDSGATQYGLFSYLKKFFDQNKRKRIRQTRLMRIKQAEIFLERFYDKLPERHLSELKHYLKANRSILPAKAYLLWRHGMLESGLWRKLYQLFSRSEQEA